MSERNSKEKKKKRNELVKRTIGKAPRFFFCTIRVYMCIRNGNGCNAISVQWQADLNQLQIKQSKFIKRHIYQIAYSEIGIVADVTRASHTHTQYRIESRSAMAWNAILWIEAELYLYFHLIPLWATSPNTQTIRKRKSHWKPMRKALKLHRKTINRCFFRSLNNIIHYHTFNTNAISKLHFYI